MQDEISEATRERHARLHEEARLAMEAKLAMAGKQYANAKADFVINAALEDRVACMECGVMNERSVCDVCDNFGYTEDNTQYEDE